MEVAIGPKFRRDIPAIDVARLVASVFNFYDVDIEPMGPGKTTLRAKSHGATITINGTSQQDVCEKFVNQLIGVKE